MMSPCGQLVLAIQEKKQASGTSGISWKNSIKDIKQLAGYMFSAYSIQPMGCGAEGWKGEHYWPSSVSESYLPPFN